MPVGTVAVVAPAHSAGIEVDVPRDGGLVRVERRRPVVAVGTRIVELRVTPVTGSGKENAVAIGGGNYLSLYARTVIVCCPSTGTHCP